MVWIESARSASAAFSAPNCRITAAIRNTSIPAEKGERMSDPTIPGLTLFNQGKVRDIYDFGDKLLLVASDRISAFDVILPTLIPDKGKILTELSDFWFAVMKDLVPHHLISTKVEAFPAACQPHKALFEGRTMLVRKSIPAPVECFVRGDLYGSGWKDYQQT